MIEINIGALVVLLRIDGRDRLLLLDARAQDPEA